MTTKSTTGQPRPRVLIVEDIFLVAEAYRQLVVEIGYEAVGPVPSVRLALDVLDREDVDIGLLDVTLRGRLVTPVAERLAELGKPFVFLTGDRDLQALPAELRLAKRLDKPGCLECVEAALRNALGR